VPVLNGKGNNLSIVNEKEKQLIGKGYKAHLPISKNEKPPNNKGTHVSLGGLGSEDAKQETETTA